jgi:CSLREA domain-containing protein
MKRIPVAALGLTLWLSAGPAAAVTFTVDTTADAVDALPGDGFCATAGGPCSLRAAVQEADALAGADAIILPAGTYVLTIVGIDDTSAAGDLDVHEDLTITGAGAATTVIDGNAASRVVELRDLVPDMSRPTLTVVGVTVRNGRAVSGDPCELPPIPPFPTASFGGGDGLCAAWAILAVVDSVVESNDRIGIVSFFNAEVTVTRSTVRSHQDPFGSFAPGILVQLASAIITDSTITGNEIGVSVQLDNLGGGSLFDVTIRNSTLSANGETGIAAGMVCEAGIEPPCGVALPVTLNNVTITGHTGTAVRNGLFFVGGSPPIPDGGTSPVFASNSILAGNGTECAGDLNDGRLTSRGYNLLQTLTGCDVVGDTTGNIVGVPAGLGPLANNGGPTATHALVGTSVAQNAGNPAAPGSGGDACEAADQRGVARPVGGRCDMGAYEGSCGNAFTDPGEECDDGNPTDGDGCQHNCALPACGDGIVDLDEECDDGGTAAGDCCSPNCRWDPPGVGCTSDGNPCTDDVCDFFGGVCTHVPNIGPCDDGDPCSLGDTCVSGTCTPQSSCGPCTVCTPGGCAAPSAICTAADSEKSRITIADSSDPTRDRVTWTWKGTGPVTADDFGDPTTFSLGWRLCAYHAAGGAALLAVATEPCDTVFGCWTATPKGFRYEQGSGIPGTVRMRLRTGSPARITVKARGTSNGVPALPLDLPVRVGLFHADPSFSMTHGCWDATYSAAKKNDASLFRAKSD